jgi:pimeloyl-ACP methyl ester carboxylesterase
MAATDDQHVVVLCVLHPAILASLAPGRAALDNVRMQRLHALLCLSLALLAQACAARAATVLDALPLVDCRLEHPAGTGSVAARCGHLSVPEDPAAPQGARLALAVAVVPALDRSTALEPVFILAGGPGQAASDFYAAYAGAFGRVLRRHDLVLVDQRGTGRSNRLGCDIPPDVEINTPSPARLAEIATACRRALPGRPEYYTTSVAVRDLDAVRAALGAPRISLYGVSYGTRVALHYVRRHAAHVRAVVLDGALPPDESPEPAVTGNAVRALGLVFARCHADAACARAFPDPAGQFERLRAALEAHPVHVRVADPTSGLGRELDLDATGLAGTVRMASYSTATVALLPYVLDRASRGEYAPLAAQLLGFSSHLERQLAYGMNLAVSCTEDLPQVTAADRARAAGSYLGRAQFDLLDAMCAGWPAGVVDADLYAPLAAPVAALVLSGELDPVTPPAFGARAAAAFADTRHIVVPGQAHGQLAVGCAPRVIAAFLAAGTARGLDTSCLEHAAPEPFVLGPSGPAP